jgi:hypothetical protein
VVGLASTVHNQRGQMVLEGRQRYLLRRRPVEMAAVENNITKS